MIHQRKRIENRRDWIALTPEEKDTTTWAQVDSSGFSEPKRQKFEKRRQAIMAYMSGERVSEVVKRFGISEWEIRRLRNRCLDRHPDGRIWGFRALVPGTHQTDYVRLADPKPGQGTKRQGYVGMLSRFLNIHKESVTIPLYLYALKKVKAGATESLITGESTFSYFIRLCRKAKVPQSEYPLATKYKGREALRRHMKQLFKSDFQAAVRAIAGDDVARSTRSQTGYLSVPGRARPRPYATGWDAGELRVRANFSEARLSEIAGDNPENGRGLISDFFREADDSRFEVDRWSTSEFKYCPACLKCGVHMSYFQLRIIEECPVHNKRLRTSCPRCNASKFYGLERNTERCLNCVCGRVFFNWDRISTTGVDAALRNAHRDYAIRLRRTLKYAHHMAFPDYWGQQIRGADVFEKCYARDFLAHIDLIAGTDSQLARDRRGRLEARRTESCVLVPRDATPKASRSVCREIVAIYKSICRHFYRKRFRAHRKSIRAIAQIATMTGDTDSGRIYWYKPRAALAHAFVLWRLLLENVESPDVLFDERPTKRRAPFVNEVVDLPNDVLRVFWKYCNIQGEKRGPQNIAILHRYFAAFALAMLDECLVHVTNAFSSSQHSKGRGGLSTNELGGFYIPLVFLVNEGEQTVRMVWNWPWGSNHGAMPHVSEFEKALIPKNEGELISGDRREAWGSLLRS